MTATVPALLDTALAWHDAGACVLPAAGDGSKRPAVAWADYQHTRPTRDQVTTWATTAAGIGLVCGAASNNLEMLELEGPAVADGLHVQLRELLEQTGHADLWAKLTTYAELTPGGGLHWLYRVDGPIPGNRKLARRRDDQGHLQVLAETRGEGGWTVLAPSAGPVHPTGKAWQIITGQAGHVATLTADEHATLHRLAATFDTADPPPPPPSTFTAPDRGTTGLRAAGGQLPGDHWAETTDWADILTPAGWAHVGTRGRTRLWRRPGKNVGISATTGHGDSGDWLYVFTSSTDFEPERTYTKFGAWTLLNHGGDHTAAAAALKAQGFGKAAPQDRTLSLIRGEAPQPPVDGATALAIDRPDSDIPAQVVASLTDHGNAQLLVATHGHRLRYVPSRGQWLTWTGQRWAWCEDDGEPIQAVTDAIQSLAPRDDAERKHKTRSLSRRGLEAAAALARRDQRIRVTADQLDADPYALNTPTGVVDLRTGQLRPATPDDLHTRLTGAPYQPGADARRWRQFLGDTFAGDQEMVGFIQRLAGYSATGVVTHHVLPFLHGAGGNGKSVFLDVLVAVLGDYASTAPADFLMSGGREDENAVARLAGLRTVVCSEVNQTSRFNEAKIKLLTGGDRLTARFLYQRHFTFTPTHTLWLMANHQPKVDAGGESFWRRLRMLPFTAVVPPEKRVEGLARQLIDAEGPGILAWIVDGARDVLTGGLREPASVLAATAQYAEEEDALARFVAERCHIGGGPLVRVATRDMRAAYEAWCRDEGEKPLSRQLLGRELRTRYGITDPRSNGRRYYAGVTLLEHEDDQLEPEPHWSDR